jgi:hypothetical protein
MKASSRNLRKQNYIKKKDVESFKKLLGGSIGFDDMCIFSIKYTFKI